MTEAKKRVAYTHYEIVAIKQIRASMKTKPEIVMEIMKDAPYVVAESVLLQAKTQTAQLLAVTRAFVEAAAVLAKAHKEQKGE